MRIAGIIILVVLVGALAGWCSWLTYDLRREVEVSRRLQMQLWDLRHDLGQLGEGHLEVQARVAEIDDILTLISATRACTSRICVTTWASSARVTWRCRREWPRSTTY